jgi:cobalamin biosynthesis Mg chelatase CobN
MREINKTFYEVLKLDEPEDGINVTQIITDDLVKKQEDGEAKAVRGATELLNRKADDLYKEKAKKPVKKVLKASGSKTKAAAPPEGLPGVPAEAPPTPKSAPVPKAAPKTTGVTPQKKAVKKVTKTSGATPKLKTTGTSPQKKVVKKTKVEAPKEKAKTSPVVLIAVVVLVLGIAGYVYMNLMS